MDIFGTERNALKQKVESLIERLERIEKSESNNQNVIQNLKSKLNRIEDEKIKLENLLAKIASDPEINEYYKSLISNLIPNLSTTKSKSLVLKIIVICPREVFEQITEIIDSSSEALRIVTVQNYSEDQNDLDDYEKARRKRIERRNYSNTSSMIKKSLDCKFITSFDSLLELKKVTKNINEKINKLIEKSESVEILALKNRQQRQLRNAIRQGGFLSLSNIFDSVDYITIDKYHDEKAILNLNIYSILN